jgi:DNA (cytosine-5)-methyltransferase 1
MIPARSGCIMETDIRYCQCCGKQPVGGARRVNGVRVILDKLCMQCYRRHPEGREQRGVVGRLSGRNRGEVMNVLDLFSGIGGFSLGLERAGMKTVAFCEIEKYPQQILRKHWPDVPVFVDVKKINGHELKGKIDVITGGFPCQDLSSAGKQNGFKGERSSLWFELYRLMLEIRPKYTIIENVANLLTGDGGGWFERVLSDLSEGGFIVEWECISAKSIGACHERNRVYIVAYPNENGWLRIFAKADIEKRRNLGNHYFFDGIFSGQGIVFNWQAAAQEELVGQPIIDRKNDGISSWIHRNSALGNSVLPQIPELIGRAIMEIEGKP